MNSSSTESIAERNRIIGAHRELILEIRELEPKSVSLWPIATRVGERSGTKAQRVKSEGSSL